ncbi:MAG: dephospho-CoA kinase [Clostridia bacterium]|nr:dephospho-CoA kinase [Clostridia bacterium]
MIIGLTGGIGSGKSTVSNYLKKNEYVVIDADEISRAITAKGTPLMDRLVDAFGPAAIDRKELAKLVFSDSKKKAVLESIVTTEVIRIVKEELKKGDKMVLDAPLLFETNMDEVCDFTILVTAPLELRISRVMARDNMSKEEILARIDNQMSEEEKIARADYVIDNGGSLEDLCKKIEEILNV